MKFKWLLTDQMDGPCGWIIMDRELQFQSDASKVEDMIWAATIEEELVGLFQVEDGLKINSKNHCQFIEAWDYMGFTVE